VVPGGKVAPPRLTSNVSGIPTSPPRVQTIDDLKVGVFGVASAARVAPLAASDPVAAAKRAVAELRKKGADVVIALAGMDRVETRKLVRAVPGIRFAVVGAEVGDGMAEPEPVGDAWLIAPADQARFVAQVKLHLAPGDKHALKLIAGEAARARANEKADTRIATLKTQLEAWKKDPSADPAFVAARQKELDELIAAKNHPTAAPAPTGPWFEYALVPVRHTIAQDPAIAADLKSLARAIGAANLAAAKGRLPPPPEAGKPSYVGDKECARCHSPAVAFWKRTVHAHAWKTLVDVDKQYNYDCIGCHVTGWEKPGGVNLATVEKRGFVDVRCEVCHGPGSKHVDEAGLDDPKTMTKRPADGFCATECHTKEHSDTFALVPYLRDILGKGHGEAARTKLGNGVTGHELRQKALAAAGR
jgi:hypothetical protein